MRSRRHQVVAEGSRADILARLKETLAEHDEIVFAYVHGSFVEGGPFRDIDLAVWVNPAAEPVSHPLDYEINLGLALQQRVKLPVDIKRLNEAPLAFRYHATRGQVLLSRDDEVRVTWVERVRDEYWDFHPVARRHLVELLRG